MVRKFSRKGGMRFRKGGTNKFFRRASQKGGMWKNKSCSALVGSPWNATQGGNHFSLGIPIGVGGKQIFPGNNVPQPQTTWSLASSSKSLMSGGKSRRKRRGGNCHPTSYKNCPHKPKGGKRKSRKSRKGGSRKSRKYRRSRRAGHCLPDGSCPPTKSKMRGGSAKKGSVSDNAAPVDGKSGKSGHSSKTDCPSNNCVTVDPNIKPPNPDSLIPQPLVNAYRVAKAGAFNTYNTFQGLPLEPSPLPHIQNSMQG